VLNTAERMIRPAGETVSRIANIPEYHFIAQELLSAGIIFDRAEDFALKSHDFREEHFIEWKRAMPSNEVMKKKYIS